MNRPSALLRPRSGRVAALAGSLVLAGLATPAVASAHTGTTAGGRPVAPARAALRVVGHWPRHTITGRRPVVVRFSRAVTVDDAPRLVTGVPGRWRQHGARTLRFSPRRDWAPYTTVEVTVTTSTRVRLAAAVHFAIQARPAKSELTRDLISLRFLPVHRSRGGHDAVNTGWPARLQGIWASDRAEMIRGAVMAFQSQHGLSIDGDAAAQTWDALDHALTAHADNTAGYTYAVGDQTDPETLTVWHDATVVLRAPANTGIADSPTEPGTFAVYERLQSQIMRGTNPDGSSYADPVSWVAYFNGGDAVHYIARADYGVPQSLGCIETSYSAAERAWHYLTYGSLVTVTPQP